MLLPWLGRSPVGYPMGENRGQYANESYTEERDGNSDMKRIFCTLKELEQYDSIICYGTGRDFHGLFSMPYAHFIVQRYAFSMKQQKIW